VANGSAYVDRIETMAGRCGVHPFIVGIGENEGPARALRSEHDELARETGTE
jgi:hypothetical protein